MKVSFKKRSKPHDIDCYCAKSEVYKFHWLPTLTLWGFNTRVYTWLYWSVLITGINKQ